MPFNLPCDDIMELIGAHVETIRKNKEYKNNYNKCINTLNNHFYKTSAFDGSKSNLFDSWMEWYMDACSWLEFLADNNDEVFVERFYTC